MNIFSHPPAQLQNVPLQCIHNPSFNVYNRIGSVLGTSKTNDFFLPFQNDLKEVKKEEIVASWNAIVYKLSSCQKVAQMMAHDCCEAE